MVLQEAITMARSLMDEHQLSGWQLRLDHARQRCGSCHFGRREITLSKHFIDLNEADEVRDTVLHEIAHALAGPGIAHGRRWRKMAQRVGARLQATNTSAAMPTAPWGLRCIACEQIVAQRHRRRLDLTRARCRHCGIDVGHLQWVRI